MKTQIGKMEIESPVMESFRRSERRTQNLTWKIIAIGCFLSFVAGIICGIHFSP